MSPLITRTPIVNDDGSMTVGTVFEDAWKQELYNQIDAALAATETAAKGGVIGTRFLTLLSSDYGELVLPNLAPHEFVFLNGHTIPILIHSLNTNGAIRNGQLVTFIGHQGVPQVSFVHYSVIQTNVSLRFANAASSAPTPVYQRGYATYQWNSTTNLWTLIAHDQGGWITPTFSAANYFGTAPMTFTVTAGQITTQAFRLVGRTLQVAFNIGGTTGGTASPAVNIAAAAYGGFTAQKGMLLPCLVIDGGGGVFAYVQVGAGGVTMNISKTVNATLGSFQAFGQLTFEVV